MLRTWKLGRGRPHRQPADPRATARCGPSPRACARRRAGSGRGSSRMATWRCSCTRAASSTSSPRPRRSRRSGPCARTSTGWRGDRRCSRRSTRWPRRARSTPGSTRCCWARCARSAARDAPLVVPAFFLEAAWPTRASSPCSTSARRAGRVRTWWRLRRSQGGRCAPGVRVRSAARCLCPLDCLALVRRILGGDLATALNSPPGPATSEVARLATRALEGHLERRLEVSRRNPVGLKPPAHRAGAQHPALPQLPGGCARSWIYSRLLHSH